MSTQNCRIKGVYVKMPFHVSGEKLMLNIIKILEGKCIDADGKLMSISYEDLIKKDRRTHIVFIRHIVMYLLFIQYGNYSRAGKIIDRDCTNVMHAVKVVNNMLDTKNPFFMYYYNLLAPAFGLSLQKSNTHEKS